MNIVLLGLNHKTAPIELRERLAIGPQQLEEATRSLMQAPGVLEGMILSTCNRVELLTSLNAGRAPPDGLRRAAISASTLSCWRRTFMSTGRRTPFAICSASPAVSTPWSLASRRSWAR